jgi:hypothetical protein
VSIPLHGGICARCQQPGDRLVAGQVGDDRDGRASPGPDTVRYPASSASCRAASTTVAPSAASIAASPAPIPADAPVTTATRPASTAIATPIEILNRHYDGWPPVPAGLIRIRSRRTPLRRSLRRHFPSDPRHLRAVTQGHWTPCPAAGGRNKDKTRAEPPFWRWPSLRCLPSRAERDDLERGRARPAGIAGCRRSRRVLVRGQRARSALLQSYPIDKAIGDAPNRPSWRGDEPQRHLGPGAFGFARDRSATPDSATAPERFRRMRERRVRLEIP